ncbi:hypothetical protein J1TS3_45390 [Siminovitchia fordii]|uniref:Uncharacterized protein n=2 Tax=Siminovitchia fordii TaxID=254759 RepID=A0ABQ4KE55_9BACI|nr:hypothetical protein J1TS3_45390 [Siminovitchia fordii]
MLKSILFWIAFFEIILIFIFYFLGFRITYAPELETSWDAVAAIGQWIGAIIGILIPLTVVYVQHILESSKRDIGESNIELLNEFKEFKMEYSEKIKKLSNLIDKEGNITLDGGYFEDNSIAKLKEKALKYINISMYANTKRVAEHLGISVEDAFNLLVEMVRHDQSISSGGQLRRDNIQSIIWTKKSKQ